MSIQNRSLIKNILHKYMEGYPIWAFGSRVTGKAKPYSDLDIVILTVSPLPFSQIGELKQAFSESDLPFSVDVLDWSRLSLSFQEAIRQQHEEL